MTKLVSLYANADNNLKSRQDLIKCDKMIYKIILSTIMFRNVEKIAFMWLPRQPRYLHIDNIFQATAVFYRDYND